MTSRLTDKLVCRDHDITLFASGNPQTLANLEAVILLHCAFNSNIKQSAIYEMPESQ
ncbi:MAG: hypothetical protein PUP92_23765 [Rhizonema sp. PD38]|nr:hypothetical protein [Rhizonema sp. PD38]